MSILCEALRENFTNNLTSIFYPDASKLMVDKFCLDFQGSVMSMCSGSLYRSPKLLCLKEAKLEPFIFVLFYTGFLYSKSHVLD